jgi:two-component system, response regulator FlrC
MMPSYAADETALQPTTNPAALFGLSPIDRECIGKLVGHTLARIECEFVLQTLRSHQGNRTRTADRLGISVRSLRDKIRNYRCSGESVPEPANRSSLEAFRDQK